MAGVLWVVSSGVVGAETNESGLDGDKGVARLPDAAVGVVSTVEAGGAALVDSAIDDGRE